jgi:hypothetical protein
MSPQQTIDTEGWEFTDWIRANSRAVTIGAAIVVLGGAGYWFYVRSGEIKRLNAERGLVQAKQSMAAGNAALATSDLQRVATRYTGTPGGVQAAMLLAQIQYDQAKYDEGLKALEPYRTARAAGGSLGAIWALTGDGQVAQGKPQDAATSFQKAADATELPGEKAVYRSKVARALMLAGKNAEARALWEALAKDPNAVLVKNEAEVRIGELSAQTAGKS